MNTCNIQSLIFYQNVTPYLHLAIHYFKPQTTALKQTSLCLLLNSKKLIKQVFFHDEAHYIGRL